MRADDFREIARQTTCLQIDGLITSPVIVMADYEERYSGKIYPMRLDLSKVALLHELNEAGEDISADQLYSFIKEDLRKFPKESIAGYLRIAHGVLVDCDPSRGVSRFFKKREPNANIQWSIVAITDVVSLEDRIVLHGVAKRIGD